jgi:hypothetical protein
MKTTSIRKTLLLALCLFVAVGQLAADNEQPTPGAEQTEAAEQAETALQTEQTSGTETAAEAESAAVPRLTGYLDAAMQESSSRIRYELQKKAQDLQLDLAGLEKPEDSGIRISGGELSLNSSADQTGDQIVKLTPSVTVNFYDIDTVLTFQAPTSINLTDVELSGSPVISVKKTFGGYTAEENTTLDELEDASERLSIDHSYQSGLLTIEKSLLQSVREITALDKSIAAARKSLDDAETSLTRDLATGKLKQNTASWTRRVNAVTRLENSLTATLASREAAADNFFEITGLTYEPLTLSDVPVPELGLSVPELGGTTVLLAALDIDIARQKLTNELTAREDEQISSKTFAYSASGSWTSDLNTPSGTYEQTLQAGLAASRSDLALEAGITAAFTGSSFEPAAYISGRWTRPETEWQEYDDLELQMLENQIALARAAYDQAYQNYQNNIQSLRLEVSSWNISSAENDLLYAEYAEALEQAQYALEKGFGTQSAVDDARHQLTLLDYDRILLDIDGLLIERDIRSLQL